MLVLLHFHDLGYTSLQLAFLFLLYEFFGIVTNLGGGYMAQRFGLIHTLQIGLGLQVFALLALAMLNTSISGLVTVLWVMSAQAISGIAKDFTKMSAKSSMKFVASNSGLFKVVARLTGSKNALKGAGFFVGGALLQTVGYRSGLLVLAGLVAAAAIAVSVLAKGRYGIAQSKKTLKSLFAKSPAINWLSSARLFLFAARDVWFVVALPVFLATNQGWEFGAVGAFMAAWVIIYGAVQAIAPRVLAERDHRRSAVILCLSLSVCCVLIAAGLQLLDSALFVVILGLVIFGVLFALSSSLHSYLVLELSEDTKAVAGDVGFYYAANAAGRLLGTLCSGLGYLVGGLLASLWLAAGFLVISAVLSVKLPASKNSVPVA